jgi:O-acetyl-ADP-ribose deacetylase (regulator of RNase III)
MVRHYRGDLFDSTADAFAHGCNTAGRMGAGIAVRFREAFPEMCRDGLFRPGAGDLWWSPAPPHVINLATQDSLGGARLEHIDACFAWLAANWRSMGIRSVAMPHIGSGRGGLDWDEVRQLLLDHFSHFELVVEI